MINKPRTEHRTLSWLNLNDEEIKEQFPDEQTQPLDDDQDVDVYRQ